MSQAGPLNSTGIVSPGVQVLQGNSGGDVGPDGSNRIFILGNLASGINVIGTPGTNTLTIVDTEPGQYNYTLVTNGSSPYTVLVSDQYLGVDTSGGAVTLRLPNAPTTGRFFTIKDRTGTAAGTNITVTTAGGVVNIDGNPTYTMNVNFQAINVLFNGTSYEVF